MASNTKDFLLAEYKSSMDVIINIDNRRATFLNYYAVIFIAAASIALTVLARAESPLSAYALYALMVLFGAIAGVGISVALVLNSERKANVRYRKRINRIRALLCRADDDAFDIEAEYLKFEQHDPKGIGSTLKIVFAIIALQVLVAIGAAVVVLAHIPGAATQAI